ncbi:pol polyprotein, partial [Nephila pilipes]
MPNPINYDEIAKSQESDLELQNLINNPQGLQLKKIVMPNSDIPLFCDLSTGTARPYIPKDYRQRIFSQLHNMSHPEVSQAWGMNTENKNEFKEVKKSKKKSSPIKSQQPKRQKTERTTELKNKFQALSSSDEEMQSIPSSASTQPSNLNQPSTSIHGQIQNQSQESNLDQTKK